MTKLRREREQLKADGLIHAENRYPVSLTLIAAIALLIIGVLAIFGLVFETALFG